MLKASINFDQVPGLNKVYCGLTTYCLDAAGRVAECSLPWPQYGDSTQHIPYTLWQVATGFMVFGLLLLCLAWLYSILACFGCFSTTAQKWSARAVMFAGIFMLIGLLCWGGSFGDVAVSKCVGDAEKVDGVCSSWQSVMPSALIEGSNDKIGCQVCPYNMKAFQPATTCKIGWGAYIIVASTVLTLFTGCFGEAVTSTQQKRKMTA